MTWEETIQEIRSNPSYKELVRDAYLGENLVDNVNRFRVSQEFKTTLSELSNQNKNIKGAKILDIGAGNGISTIAFALEGLEVVALEPDPSNTIGAGAIRKAAAQFEVENKVEVVEAWGEKLPFEDQAFDIVFGRQVMHHAHELEQFVAEAARVLKKGGLLMTVRDHVISDDKDKEAFLNRHPLHKFYGGENAFTIEEYTGAIKKANLKILKSIGPSDSPINYDPWTKGKMKETIANKIGSIFSNNITTELAWKLQMSRLNKLPGRLYSFIATKN